MWGGIQKFQNSCLPYTRVADGITLMRIRIRLFTLMQTWILLLIKVMGIWSKTLQVSILSFHTSIVSVHGSPLFYFEHLKLWILTLMRIRIQLFTLMRIRIQLPVPKIMRVRIRNPTGYYYTYVGWYGPADPHIFQLKDKNQNVCGFLFKSFMLNSYKVSQEPFKISCYGNLLFNFEAFSPNFRGKRAMVILNSVDVSCKTFLKVMA